MAIVDLNGIIIVWQIKKAIVAELPSEETNQHLIAHHMDALSKLSKHHQYDYQQ